MKIFDCFYYFLPRTGKVCWVSTVTSERNFSDDQNKNVLFPRILLSVPLFVHDNDDGDDDDDDDVDDNTHELFLWNGCLTKGV